MITCYSPEAGYCIFCVVQIVKHLILKHVDLKNNFLQTEIIYSKPNLSSRVQTLQTKLFFYRTQGNVSILDLKKPNFSRQQNKILFFCWKDKGAEKKNLKVFLYYTKKSEYT